MFGPRSLGYTLTPPNAEIDDTGLSDCFYLGSSRAIDSTKSSSLKPAFLIPYIPHYFSSDISIWNFFGLYMPGFIIAEGTRAFPTPRDGLLITLPVAGGS